MEPPPDGRRWRDRRAAPARATLGDRLVGLGVIAFGLLGLGVAMLLMQSEQLLRPPTPPGLPAELMPLTSPLRCFVPIIALGSLGLIFVGLRRLITGE